MQLKIFTIPMLGGETEMEEMNAVLRGNKILYVTEAAVVLPGGSWWSYSVRYLKGAGTSGVKRAKVDYRQVLDASTFNYFSTLRSRRKALAEKEAVPAYVIFTDAELAEIAKQGEGVALSALRSIAGIGKQKLTKYGPELLKLTDDEASK
jgi:superfamily II DNA helicase RecQ